MTRTEHSLRNLRAVLVFQTSALFTAFLTRKIFVDVLSQEYLGLDGTFSNILVALSLAELGLGDAITFSLYKPLAEKDTRKLCALMGIYQRAYQIIGIVVALLGCAIAPFLPVLIRDLPDLPYVYLIYFLFVANSVLSYFFVYKQSLILADQKRYVITSYRYGFWTVLYLAQAVFLLLTREYLVYLVLQLVETLLENWILARKAEDMYPFLRKKRTVPLDHETRKNVTDNTKAMFLHKIGGVMVFNTDNLLLSYFIGVVAVGVYSNYLLVIKGLRNFYKMLFGAFTGSVGNLGATCGKENALSVYRRMNFAGSWLIGWCSICLMILFNPFLELWVGPEYLFSADIVLLIVLNFYVTGMREVNQTFQNAYGLFQQMKYKSIVEAIINLIVSIALVRPFGVAGIFVGTLSSTMLTCFWAEPYIVYRHALGCPVRRYFYQYGVSTVLTAVAGYITWLVCTILPGTGIVLFSEMTAVCAILPNIIFVICLRKNEEYFFLKELFCSRFKER